MYIYECTWEPDSLIDVGNTVAFLKFFWLINFLLDMFFNIVFSYPVLLLFC